MKKVILSASALILGGMLYAQTPGTPAAAEVIAPLPLSAVGANTGQSTQNGNENKVLVFQAGTSQSASTYQDDGTGTGDNQISIMQTGNVGPLSGVQNSAEARQSGTENQMIINQQGDTNSSLTRQGQNDASSARNTAWVRQGTGQQAQDNAAEVNQDGDDNIAKVKQTFDNSTSLINQTGDGNKAFTNQDAGPNQTDGHAAEMRQTGDDNQAYSFQEGNGARNNAIVVQEGDDNKSYQTQFNSGTAGGATNDALVAQGDGTIGTNLLGSIWVSQLQALDDITNGSFNGPSVGAIAYQDQIGAGNDAEIHQFGGQPGGSDYAEQNQLGDDNDAIIVQNAFGSANGSSNYARQDQDGDSNQAGLAQNGSNHKAYQTQKGDLNIAMSTQRGNGNKLNTHQLGDMNVVNTAQRGTDNGILVVQYGGQSYSVQQNLPPGANGGNNQVNVFQTTPDGFNPGIDCGFEDPRTEMGNYNTPTLDIQDVCPGC